MHTKMSQTQCAPNSMKWAAPPHRKNIITDSNIFQANDIGVYESSHGRYRARGME